MAALDADFDSAHLDVDASRIEGDVIRLVGHDDFKPDCWKWIHFKLRDAAGTQPTFVLSDQFSEGPDRLKHHAMVFSGDGIHWHYFAHHELDNGEYRFHHDRPFRSDVIRIAYAIPYPWTQLALWLGDYERQMIGPCQPYIQFGAGPRDIVLMSGVHPNETLAGYTLEGAVDYLRDHPPKDATIHVFPMVNPTGRVHGRTRTTMQHHDRDANRVWTPELWRDMEDIRTIANALPKGKWDVFVDFHCWTDARPHFAFLDKRRGYHEHPIWRRLMQLEPTIEHVDCGTENASTETLAIEQHDAGFAMTFETTYNAGEMVDRFRELGRHVGRAIAEGMA